MAAEIGLQNAWQAIKSGQFERAEAIGRDLLQREPENAVALELAGFLHFRRGDLKSARDTLLHLLPLVPKAAGPRNNLAALLLKEGRTSEAEERLREAISLDPTFADAYSNLGHALRRQGRIEEARVNYAKALSLSTGHSDAIHGLAAVQAAVDDFDGAIETLSRGIKAKPTVAETHSRLGSMFAQTGRYDDALACYEEALRLDPQNAEAHKRRALVWLRKGEFVRGWQEYEWRWSCPPLRPYELALPLWDGAPLDGGAILLQAEQGAGDIIQFLRYAPIVKRLSGEVIVRCPRRLHALARSCSGIDRLVAEEEASPRAACYAPLMSLPRLLGTTLQTIPADVPYLRADPSITDMWRNRLGTLVGLKIGIAWQGNSQYAGDRRRSIPLVEFASLAEQPAVHLISLQKGGGSEQAAQLAGRFGLTDLGAFDEQESAFADSAAIISNLDLVISSDTAIAHLAGALGAPVWVALSDAADWRWLLDRDDSPWYPTMTLFRQTRSGDWRSVFGRMAEHIKHALAAVQKDEPLVLKPDTADWWNLRGILLAEGGRLRPGIDCLRRAIERRPGFADAYNNLAIAQSRSGHEDEAIVNFGEAIRLDSRNSRFYNNLGGTLALLGRFDEAIKSLKHACELSPRYIDALVNLGKAYLETGHGEQAALVYDRLIGLRPNLSQTSEEHPWHSVMRLLQEAKYGEANHAAEETNERARPSKRIDEDADPAGALKPRGEPLPVSFIVDTSGESAIPSGQFSRPPVTDASAKSFSSSGAAHALAGRFAEAAADFRRALDIEPESRETHLNLGASLGQLGRHGEAESYLRRAIALSPDWADAHVNLGVVLLKTGRRDEAEQAFR